MRQTGTAYTVEEIKNLRLKGAIYIRMSTELQVESPENQEREIRAYADSYDIEIIKVYADLGVSGMTAEKREQFQALLDDVESGHNDYQIVLYLDDSRWGRFVDSREADYYRMQLERKGVICQACDKNLTMTSTIADRIMTILSATAPMGPFDDHLMEPRSARLMEPFDDQVMEPFRDHLMEPIQL